MQHSHQGILMHDAYRSYFGYDYAHAHRKFLVVFGPHRESTSFVAFEVTSPPYANKVTRYYLLCFLCGRIPPFFLYLLNKYSGPTVDERSTIQYRFLVGGWGQERADAPKIGARLHRRIHPGLPA